MDLAAFSQSPWANAGVAALHYTSFMVMFAALTLELFTLNPDLDLRQGWRVLIADGVYGITATLVLITGILRVLYFGKGSAYYLSNPVFYWKVGIFLAVGTLSLYPTVVFIRWIGRLQEQHPPELKPATLGRLTWMIRLELIGYLLLPLLAAIMARGLGPG